MRLILLFALVSSVVVAGPLPEASPAKLPRWRGFNLLEKFIFNGKHEPFREDDFRLISQLGFNFVRLPMDYRGYIVKGDWEKFDEAPLRQIDEAVTFGSKHGVHVCLNLHRAPGWTVAKPAEAKDLWTDPEAQRVAALHWGMFAKRYQGIPNSRLSFNLFNEPAGIKVEAYLTVVKKMLDAIRAADPDRLVFCDGLEWGRQPVNELVPLRVAMMTRGYSPFQLTHYRASWVNSEGWEEPRWPEIGGTGGALLGTAKAPQSFPLRIAGPVAAGSVLRLEVATLSTAATIVVEAGGKEIARHALTAGPQTGPWRKLERDPQWNNLRAEGPVSVIVPVPAATDALSVRVTDGDWLALSAVSLTAPGGGVEAKTVLRGDQWGKEPEELRYQPANPGFPALGVWRGRDWLRGETVDPWKPFVAAGGAVMVGEWGAFQHTPHDVVLRWAEDCLANWKDAGWGWALWNFRGTFGVLDSERKDVEYEDLEGHQLDRKLLDLLRRF